MRSDRPDIKESRKVRERRERRSRSEKIMHLLHFALLRVAASLSLSLSLFGVYGITRDAHYHRATSSRVRLSRESARSRAIQIQINGLALIGSKVSA